MRKAKTFKDFEKKSRMEKKFSLESEDQLSTLMFEFDDDHIEIHGHTCKHDLRKFLFMGLFPSLKKVLLENFDEDAERFVMLAKWQLDLEELVKGSLSDDLDSDED